MIKGQHKTRDRLEVFCEAGHLMVSLPGRLPDAEQIARKLAADLGCRNKTCTAPVGEVLK